MNLFESFKNIVDQDFITKIRPNLEDNLGDFEVAIDGIYYTLVAGLIRRTNSDMSAGMLFNQIQEKFNKSSIQENMREAFFNKDLFVKISNEGSKIISQIFPAYKSPLISMISTYASTSKNNTVLFTGMTASILIDILGHKIKSEKMTKEDLVYFLKQHHEDLFKVAPESLMEKMIPALGLQELIHMKFNPNQKKTEAPKAVDVSDEEPKEYKKLESISNNSYNSSDAPLISKKLLIGLIGAAVAGAIGFYVYANRDNIGFLNPQPEEQEELMVDESLLAPSADSLAKIKADSLALAKADSLTGDTLANDIAQVNEYLLDKAEVAGKEFDFLSIEFLPGGFEIKPTSLPIIEKLAETMKANATMQIKVTAFDEKGNAKLANKRAFAVKRYLQEKGVSDLRIDAGPGGVGGLNPRIKIIKK